MEKPNTRHFEYISKLSSNVVVLIFAQIYTILSARCLSTGGVSSLFIYYIDIYEFDKPELE